MELTEIVREYIEGRFELLALESTTDEIMEDIKGVGIEKLLKKKLNDLLVTGDLAKLAKAKPLPNENERSLASAYDFVKETKPIPVQKEEGHV